MTNWPDAKRIEKPCEQCKEPMFCTPQRKICSKCRRKNERAGKKRLGEIRKFKIDLENLPLITYCEDCHKINHQLIPELKFSENYVKCPICGDNFCHIIKQEHFAGDDKYRAWEGRGDLYLTIFYGECGSVFAKAYGEHKGNIVQGDLLIKSCGVYNGK